MSEQFVSWLNTHTHTHILNTQKWCFHNLTGLCVLNSESVLIWMREWVSVCLWLYRMFSLSWLSGESRHNMNPSRHCVCAMASDVPETQTTSGFCSSTAWSNMAEILLYVKAFSRAIWKGKLALKGQCQMWSELNVFELWASFYMLLCFREPSQND